MKRHAGIVLAGIAGFLTGSAITTLLVFSHWEARYAELFAAGVQGNAFVVLQIQRGNQKDLQTRMLQGLEDQAAAVAHEFPRTPFTTPALSLVRAAYEETGVPIPERVRGILDALPEHGPGASCSRPDASGKR